MHPALHLHGVNSDELITLVFPQVAGDSVLFENKTMQLYNTIP